ncbi:MAG: hypothetical protein ACO3N4_06610 [Ilumatobacteraceae bacterium]|jgi:hypothetical protein
MAESAIPKVLRDGTLVIKDGTTPTANTHTVQYSDAVSLTLTETAAIHIFNRGTRVYTRKGNDAIPTISFTVIFTGYTDGTDGTALDAMRKTGAFSSWVKSLATVEHYNVTLEFTVAGTSLGDDADHKMTLTGVRLLDSVPAEGDPYNVSFNCEVLGTVTFTGPT